MAPAGAEHPVCPTHDTYMIPHTFQTWELSLAQGTVNGFRCPNLICPIVYISGELEGFHKLEPSGDLTPYTA
jgi:hypothetical protein